MELSRPPYLLDGNTLPGSAEIVLPLELRQVILVRISGPLDPMLLNDPNGAASFTLPETVLTLVRLATIYPRKLPAVPPLVLDVPEPTY